MRRRLVLLPLLLLALLGAAPLVAADEAEEADESALVEEAIAECEADPACAEEGEVEEAEAEAAQPPECVLRSAKAHAVLARGKLKLTIGYTASEAVSATITLRYGVAKLGSLKRNLRRSGVVRVSKKLRGRQADSRLPLRIELAPEGAGCAARRLVLFPK